MDFVFGVMGVLQITAMPGLILHKIFKLRGNLLDRMLMVFGLSLIANYCVIFLLSAVGAYTRAALGVFITVELAVIIWLYRAELVSPSVNFLANFWDGLERFIDQVIPKRQKNSAASILYYFFIASLMLVSVREIIWLVNVFIKNLGTVFSTWDAVVSWNRWANVWAAGQIPADSHFYPQLIPLNWSVTYVLMGDIVIQFFAKGIMPLFALFLVAAFFNLAIDTARYYFFISAALMGILLRDFLSPGISNGYADVAVAFFSFLAVYMLIKAREAADDAGQQDKMLLIGAVFSAGAAVTKQPGVYIALCYPLLAFVIMGVFEKGFDRNRLKTFLSRMAVISLIWVSWYLFKQIQILSGTDRPNLDILIELTANKYEAGGLFQQILAAIGQFERLVFLIVVTIAAFPLMDRFHRFFVVLVAPYPILWAWMAGYDTRNLAVFFPFLALSSGYAIHLLSMKVFDLAEKIKLNRVPLYVPVLLACAVLLYFNSVIPPEKLINRQEALQKQIFSPVKNQMLYDLVEKEGGQTIILTNYPMEQLPGLKQYQVRFNFQDYDMFIAYVENPLIEYIFFPNAINDDVKEYINNNWTYAKVSEGDIIE